MPRAYGLLPLICLLSSCGTTPTTTAKNEPPPQPQTQAKTSRHRHGHHASSSAPQTHTAASRTTAGQFDFYVMSLSWSPGFCATAAGRNSPMQCAGQREFAFVMHGLWPQYENGGWPETCSTEPLNRQLGNSMLDIMPSPSLVAHEWEKHGTCSGLTQQEYFEDATDAFHAVKIPAAYQGPKKQIVVDPAKLRDDFAAANPDIGEAGFTVLCSRNGRFLEEVRVCLNKDLDGRACNREVAHHECKSPEVIMTPLR